MDETVVATALPTIQKDLSMSLVESHWVINSYLLVIAGFIAVGGKLGDIIGYRVLFVAGVLIFGLSSLAAGFAESTLVLLVTRAVQGIGGAIIFPASMALLAVVTISMMVPSLLAPAINVSRSVLFHAPFSPFTNSLSVL